MKTKKDTNARVAGQRERTKESAVEQLCMDDIPMGLKEFDDSSSLHINVFFSFFFRCFHFFKLVYEFPWSMFTYNLRELHLI